VLYLDRPAVAVAWFVAARLAYVLYVGRTLRTRERRGAGAPDADPRTAEAEWTRFRVRASWLMDHDAVAFVTLCLVTFSTWRTDLPWAVTWTVGGVLVVAGFSVKAWAAASLPPGSYHWRSFFLPGEAGPRSRQGPYRWISSPMYTLGYAHAYGAAVAARSLHGLAAAAFAHAAILALHVLVERPHVRRTHS